MKKQRTRARIREISMPRFADPWAFRSPLRPPKEGVADFHGRGADAVVYRRNGRPTHVVAPCDPLDPRGTGPAGQSRLFDLRRYLSAILSRYRTSGVCTETDLRTIDGLMLSGLGLRAFARAEGVTATAISDRVARMQHRCPEFYRFWLRRNRWWRTRRRSR